MTTKDIPITRTTTSDPLPRPPAAWTGFGSLRDEIERLFDTFEPRQWFERGPRLFRDDTGMTVLSPAMDLTESPEGYRLVAELPGLEPAQITVKLSNGSLAVSGQKSEERKSDDETWHMRERRWDSFQRSIRLPENVETDKVEAQFANGILTVTLPKTAVARASERTVSVTAA
ncbi:Hsp20/alpha crystallin family protein [Sagittula salina]|uniref:Hsp20/alpha crystallin family protein n=1 Tax=Sagittula salina TaxID=2820268 RepID=A0A940S0M8_9RHOB|nr:Hsp20/alpha crystallin family protein [Sagittula salina]MBP0482192.1 Hsp20/alpha crystallin family protein [Sagittula salina]